MELIPESLDDARIDLVAISPARNLRRRYAIATARDLFGHFIVELLWGRIGTRGRSKLVSFARESEVRAAVRAVLRRRAGSRARIGVDYVSARKCE